MDFVGNTAESTTLLESKFTGLTTGTSDTYPATDLVYDVREFNGYYLGINAYQSDNATALNALQINIDWFSTNDPVAVSPVYTDLSEIFVDQEGIAGAYRTQLGPLSMQDTMHGPYMQVRLTNTGTQTVYFYIDLFGTNRIISNPFVRQGGYSAYWSTIYDYDGVLTAGSGNLAAAASLDIPLKVGYGRAWLRSNFSGNTSYVLQSGLGGPVIDATLSSATVVYRELVLPKRAVKATLTNNTAGNIAWNFTVVTQFDKV